MEFHRANHVSTPQSSTRVQPRVRWSPPYSLYIFEALAVARAISFAFELGLSSFILDGDSEIVIKSLISEDVSFSPFGHILALAKPPYKPAAVFLFFMLVGL